MKQLLQGSSCKDAECMIMALGTQAYVTIWHNDSEVLHLVPLMGDTDNPKVSSATTKTDQQPDAKVKDTERGDTDSHPKEIQSVAIWTAQETQNSPSSTLEATIEAWCAVARYDKTLSLFRIDISSLKIDDAADSGSSGSKKYHQPAQAPVQVYRTSKRAGSLYFATLSTPEPAATTLVLLAGDLAGDVTAFPTSNVATTTEKDKDNQGPSGKLLLGHTASMLTGVQVVTHGDASKDAPKRLVSRILSSDRDEKIRVSSFPDAFRVEGYLLGHDAFVSSFDTSTSSLSSGQCCCISCSGDGTLRLWDIPTCTELAQTPPVVTTSNDAEWLVPSRVALQDSLVVVIYDHSTRLDVYEIVESSSGVQLKATQQLQCPAQPLSLHFVPSKCMLVVLLTEPAYLQVYQYQDCSNDKLSRLHPCEFAPCTELVQTAKQIEWKLPTTILEKDPYGNFKMKKLNETRAVADGLPWNRADRVGIAKERGRRAKKRRQERKREERKARKESKK